MLTNPVAFAGGDGREGRTRVVGRESQCRRRSSAVPPPPPTSDEATYQQIPHHVALTFTARGNAVTLRGLGLEARGNAEGSRRIRSIARGEAGFSCGIR